MVHKNGTRKNKGAWGRKKLSHACTMLTNGKEHRIKLHHSNTRSLENDKDRSMGEVTKANTQAHTAPQCYLELNGMDI